MTNDFTNVTPEFLSLLKIMKTLQPGESITRGDHKYSCSQDGAMVEWSVWGKKRIFSDEYEWQHVGNVSKEFIETLLDNHK